MLGAWVLSLDALALPCFMVAWIEFLELHSSSLVFDLGLDSWLVSLVNLACLLINGAAGSVPRI